MADDNEQQAEADKALVASVKKHQTANKKSWNGAQSKAVIKDLLVGKNGKPVALDPEDDLLISVLADPTLDTQMKVLEKVAKEKGCDLDQYQLINIRRVMNPQLFRQELVGAEVIEKPKKVKKTSMKLLFKA